MSTYLTMKANRYPKVGTLKTPLAKTWCVLVPKLCLGMPSCNAPRCEWRLGTENGLFDAPRRGRHSQTEFGNEGKINSRQAKSHQKLDSRVKQPLPQNLIKSSTLLSFHSLVARNDLRL